MRGPASTTVTRSPTCVRRQAASAPATPAPTIKTSAVSLKFVSQRLEGGAVQIVGPPLHQLGCGSMPAACQINAVSALRTVSASSSLKIPEYQASSKRFSTAVPRYSNGSSFDSSANVVPERREISKNSRDVLAERSAKPVAVRDQAKNCVSTRSAAVCPGVLLMKVKVAAAAVAPQ
jgi:hypothetical protein